MTATERFQRLPTAAKLFLILTAAILPIGLALVWVGERGIREANAALEGRGNDQARSAARAMESLIARNALALRIAANGALGNGTNSPCDDARRALAISPAIAESFELESIEGRPICAVGQVGDTGAMPLVAPGAIHLQVAPAGNAIAIRTGVIGGMATTLAPLGELQALVKDPDAPFEFVSLRDGSRELMVLEAEASGEREVSVSEWPIANGALKAKVGMGVARITTSERLLLLLPVLMWVAAAVITWLLVSRLLIRPLKRLQRGVANYKPGSGPLDVPRKLGPSREIQELRDAFARALARVEESEREMTDALEGQRRLVREVHHRVKNNLQVVASLLNIHGRSAATPEARAAYAGISRRVGALSIVHRNHFAEMEESRGIAVRPLLTELAAELRAGAPEEARGFTIDLDVDTVHTTQDVAVAIAFLVTEIVEFAMVHCPDQPMEISLRRSSELTARMTLSNRVLNPETAEQPDKVQFERIVGGLAKQLRSPLDRKLGRYSVDLPVFPAN